MKEKSVSTKLFTLALPILGSMLTQQLYAVMDTAIVGRMLGTNALGAVGNATSIVILAAAVSGGLELGSEISLSRLAGKNAWQRIANTAPWLFLAIFICSVMLAAGGLVFSEPLMGAMGVPAEMRRETLDYMRVYLLGMSAIFVYDIARSVLLVLGKAHLTLMLVLISSLLNIGLDVLFIGPLQMGVAGAALATVLAQAIGLGLCMILLLRQFHKLGVKPGLSAKKEDLLHVWSMSYPNGLQQLATTLSITLLQTVVNTFGAATVSGYAVTSKLFTLALIPVFGVTQAHSILTAQYLGGGKEPAARRSFRATMAGCIGSMAVVSIAILLWTRPIAGLFFDVNANPEAYEFVQTTMVFSIPAFFLGAWGYAEQGDLRGRMRMQAHLVASIVGLCSKVAFSALLAGALGSLCFAAGSGISHLLLGLAAYGFLHFGKARVQPSDSQPPDIPAL